MLIPSISAKPSRQLYLFMQSLYFSRKRFTLTATAAFKEAMLEGMEKKILKKFLRAGVVTTQEILRTVALLAEIALLLWNCYLFLHHNLLTTKTHLWQWLS